MTKIIVLVCAAQLAYFFIANKHSQPNWITGCQDVYMGMSENDMLYAMDDNSYSISNLPGGRTKYEWRDEARTYQRHGRKIYNGVKKVEICVRHGVVDGIKTLNIPAQDAICQGYFAPSCLADTANTDSSQIYNYDNRAEYERSYNPEITKDTNSFGSAIKPVLITAGFCAAFYAVLGRADKLLPGLELTSTTLSVTIFRYVVIAAPVLLVFYLMMDLSNKSEH